MSTHFTLVRHGQTAWNVERRWQGHAAVPLDSEGQRQAVLLGEYLVGTQFDLMYSSDLLRTRQTAHIVNDYLGLPLKLDRRLREIDVGEWQGITYQELQEWDRERLKTIFEDADVPRLPGGESYVELADRGSAALYDYARLHSRKRLLIVTHGGTIRETIRRLTQIQSPNVVPNTSMTTLVYDDDADQWEVTVFGETPHFSVSDQTAHSSK